MSAINVLGIDLGASSGKGIIGAFDGWRLSLEEIHRFPNRPVTVLSGFYWDILSLFCEVKAALIKSKAAGCKLDSMAIDAWSQSFALIDKNGNMLANPRHYWDSRADAIYASALEKIPEYDLFIKTGMRADKAYILFHVLAALANERHLIELTDKLLFIPDLLNFFLTGQIFADPTIASVSMLYDQSRKTWSQDIMERYGIPGVLPPIIPCGSLVGGLLKNVSGELGIGALPVFSVAAHDTASAYAAAPFADGNTVVISCGTWTSIGIDTDEPIISREAFDLSFCNEGGYDRNLFIKNLIGMWIIQECIREWRNDGFERDYDYFNRCASESGFDSLIDVDSPEFTSPGNMSGKIRDYLLKSGQPAPESREETYRCVMLSLAVKYKAVIEDLETVAARRFDRINIIGGGAKNGFLCEMTARLTGKAVYAGPYEATVIGNIAAQLIALGEFKGIGEAREAIRQSFTPEFYQGNR